MNRKPLVRALGALAITAATAMPALASPLTLTGWYYGPPSPEDVTIKIAPGESVTYPLGGASYSSPLDTAPSAGAFKATWGSLVNFETYCTDLFHPMDIGSPGSPVTYNAYVLWSAAAYLGAQKAHDIGSLWNIAHGSVNASNTDSFQLAIWEITNENPGKAYSLGSGAVISSAGAAGLANTWLNAVNLAAGDGRIYNVQMLVHTPPPGHGKIQDLLLPVPEPETYAMFLAGLGMMGYVARRRGARRS